MLQAFHEGVGMSGGGGGGANALTDSMLKPISWTSSTVTLATDQVQTLVFFCLGLRQ